MMKAFMEFNRWILEKPKALTIPMHILLILTGAVVLYAMHTGEFYGDPALYIGALLMQSFFFAVVLYFVGWITNEL